MYYDDKSIKPLAKKTNQIQGEHYRITVLTGRLLRFEYSETGIFEDGATQVILDRDFAEAEFYVEDTQNQLILTTNNIKVIYDKKKFSRTGLRIKLCDKICNYGAAWNYGEKPDTLFGTARTLDGVNGTCELQDGLMSYNGISILDDSASLILREDGWVEPRKQKEEDFYLFGYGHDFTGCLKDFYKLSGRTPMLPRYALGNWWSRYYKYDETSYRRLISRFEEEQLPFTVAVLDMDWHITEPDKKYGSGWTGYTWNRDYFPEPERFLEWLHQKGMRVTLNDHPADGIRAFEEGYPNIAAELKVDATKEEPVECDITEKAFVNAWFTHILRPLEKQGVDFWWIDWQQGQTTKMEGLDPLWMQNHVRFHEAKRKGKRPLILSRFAGPGSHRYPAGFSGDTVITWESLEFQPYFTSTAANIGYGWWSHDIGGHMQGYKDDELAGRWVQLGVFSPICRLHSSSSEFSGKEPWNYRMDVHQMMNHFLRLRHQMLPYLYTMNYRSYQYGEPLVQPMYYKNPEEYYSYQVKNQYYFGETIIVAPITTKCIEGIHKAKVKVWLPEGLWYDLFTGHEYQGNRFVSMYRGIESMPVLVKAGAILPFTEEIVPEKASCNPTSLAIRIFAGADGQFELYEDDNETCGYESEVCVKTNFEWKNAVQASERANLYIRPAAGDTELIPEVREYQLEFIGCQIDPSEVSCLINGEIRECISFAEASKSKLILSGIRVTDEVQVMVKTEEISKPELFLEELYQFLNQLECDFLIKEQIYSAAKRNQEPIDFMKEIQAFDLDADLIGCIADLL